MDENKNTSFEDAKSASEALFEEQPLIEEAPETPDAQEVAEAESASSNEARSEEAAEPAAVESPEESQLAEASNIAEIAAQTASDKDSKLKAALAQIEQLQQQIAQMSQQQEEKIEEEVLEPPTFDWSSLAFADEETLQKAQAEYSQKLSDYNRAQIMKELSPYIEQAKEGMYEKKKRDVVAALSSVPELEGLEDMMPQIEKIIQGNAALSSDALPLDEKIITAYAIAKGVNSMNDKKTQPSADELMKLYDSNPDFQAAIEKKRIEAIKGSQQVPTFSASSGAVNAALNVKDKPKTFEEASKRTREMFGLD